MNRLALDTVLIGGLNQELLQEEQALREAQTHAIGAELEKTVGASSKEFPETEAGLPA